MDEWRDHLTFIKSLILFNPGSSVVRFILTDRLNPCASQLPGIDSLSIQTFALGPISREVIKTYFEKYLRAVPWVDGRKASPADVEKLTELSGGLPVWAATVISLLSRPFNESPPHEILSEIVGNRRQVGGSDGLGQLYCNALKRLFPTPDDQKHFRRVMGAIIVLQESLSLFDFSVLTGIPSHLIKNILSALSALQTRSPPSGSETMIHPATTLFHLSFIEYVQAAGTETSFAISAFESHSGLGLSCLEQLSSLPSLSPHHDSRLRAIQDYAVRYSPYHVSNGTPRSNDSWSRTKHCGILRAMSAGTQRQWPTLFHKALLPGDDSDGLELEMEDGMGKILVKLAERLHESGGDQWGFEVACLEVAVRIDNGDAEAWSNLGWCYDARGDRMGGIQMHKKALVAFRHALKLCPESHPDHAESLHSVSKALWSCYQLNGNQDALGEMILCSRKALTLCPAPHPDHDKYLGTLAVALDNLYRHNGDLQTLKKVISLHRQGLELCPAPHPERSTTLNNLAGALQCLHMHDNGDIDALKEAISLYREALELHPAPHPDFSSSLDNLASALCRLFKSNGDEKALNEAISLQHEALALEPAPHPGRSITLNNLANSLKSRYQRNGNINTLNECISLYREALGLCPAPHPTRPPTLNNLANVLLLQFEQNREVEVLDEAVSLRRELLILHPSGHRHRKDHLKDILHLLEMRREVTGDDRDHGEIDDVKAELATL
jgi:tetratricopeptide (TPR) repeat protein